MLLGVGAGGGGGQARAEAEEERGAGASSPEKVGAGSGAPTSRGPRLREGRPAAAEVGRDGDPCALACPPRAAPRQAAARSPPGARGVAREGRRAAPLCCAAGWAVGRRRARRAGSPRRPPLEGAPPSPQSRRPRHLRSGRRCPVSPGTTPHPAAPRSPGRVVPTGRPRHRGAAPCARAPAGSWRPVPGGLRSGGGHTRVVRSGQHRSALGACRSLLMQPHLQLEPRRRPSARFPRGRPLFSPPARLGRLESAASGPKSGRRLGQERPPGAKRRSLEPELPGGGCHGPF